MNFKDNISGVFSIIFEHTLSLMQVLPNI